MKCNYNPKKSTVCFTSVEDYLKAKKILIEDMKKDFHYNEDFERLFLSLANKHGKAKLWRDFIIVSACKISNLTDERFRDLRERWRNEILSEYSDEEKESLNEMLTIVRKALQSCREQDFLGDMYDKLDPYGRAMTDFDHYYKCARAARENLDPIMDNLHNGESAELKCGNCETGCIMIAFANEALNAGINFQTQLLFIGQDENFVDALACYIQLSLLGCKAVIKTDDADLFPYTEEDLKTSKVWLTPMYTRGDDILKYFDEHLKNE